MQNNKIKNISSELLSDNWYTLRKFSYEYQRPDGEWEQHEREAYDRGNGATILLYNTAQKTVILTKQFRLPTFINGNASGMLIETCAGLLDNDHPEEAIKRETEEETGYQISEVTPVFQAYMSPGSVTEILYFFTAEYSKAMQVSEGGGAKGETENIEVLELPFEKAYALFEKGAIKDGKTIMLLQHLKLKGIL